ncbi:hypothetical protein HA466_0031410 [Hirschfeldia incana]|nr:hypothetical protein HA466_0031410 [Hirschfeldia incana]
MKGGYSHKSVLPHIPHELKKKKSKAQEMRKTIISHAHATLVTGDSGIVPPQFVLLSKDHNIASLQQSTRVQVQPRSYTRKKTIHHISEEIISMIRRKKVMMRWMQQI